ncbi:hypothetical protein Z517_09031 [Fonsecaea pedrosoi CBS 271.37]|uniref:Glyoxalase-like domain-containing protein n=1 Tax=Fonsecaea pedrosoi CBS 271.37 TaxID=1442368 RepID=A0A0D2EQL0_9EURO|nr:uncharacterized protein Z517_09031 [Fonsecaea pedrosoi CBS 271.37]KIW76587.1 hypothetical protein Z517_09031 [Fonsecaea pedrosoi CBS 271.37]
MASAKEQSIPPVAPTRLRQIALITEDYDRARDLLTRVLDTEVVFVDPQVAQWGLKNFLVAVGGDLIEVCSPFKPNTTVGRLLEKRGDGGYMIIMQTLDAASRRKYIESRNLARVIFHHSHGDVECVQYHPKGIAGGMMPELDSHTPSATNSTPLESPFSPWHACGSDYPKYSAGMRRRAHLKLVRAVLRLAPGQTDVHAAAQQWQDYFGVERRGSELVFTNARLSFVPGVEGSPEGLESITIAVQGKERLDKMLRVVSDEGLCGNGWTNMLGVKWYFELQGEENDQAKGRESRL